MPTPADLPNLLAQCANDSAQVANLAAQLLAATNTALASCQAAIDCQNELLDDTPGLRTEDDGDKQLPIGKMLTTRENELKRLERLQNFLMKTA